jgi:hypothetical protein
MKGRVCWLSSLVSFGLRSYGLKGYGPKGYGPKGDFFLFSCSIVLDNHNFFLLTFQIMAFKIGPF